jgi:hypothetical protein
MSGFVRYVIVNELAAPYFDFVAYLAKRSQWIDTGLMTGIGKAVMYFPGR